MIEKKGKELLRAYREADINSFLYRQKLEDELEWFIHKHDDDYGLTFDLFLNDSGKYIVIHTYHPYRLTRETIHDLCKEYGVTYEGVTIEVHEDYEGNKREDKATYLFEIIK